MQHDPLEATYILKCTFCYKTKLKEAVHNLWRLPPPPQKKVLNYQSILNHISQVATLFPDNREVTYVFTELIQREQSF